MREYIVFRNGWDESNQSRSQGLPEKMAVLRVEADSAEEACRFAASHVSVTPRQHLSAEPADAADSEEMNRNLRAEAL